MNQENNWATEPANQQTNPAVSASMEPAVHEFCHILARILRRVNNPTDQE